MTHLCVAFKQLNTVHIQLYISIDFNADIRYSQSTLNSIHLIISIRFIYIFTFTDSTPLRKDTGVFESYSRLIIILLD